MVVGQARTGKTSLLRALNNLPFNDNEASTHVAEVVEVKVGEWSMTGAIYPAQDLFTAISQKTKKLPNNNNQSHDAGEKPLEDTSPVEEMKIVIEEEKHPQELFTLPDETRSADAPLSFTTWDFAGQEIFYSIHRVFITDRSHYIVVFSLKEAEEDIKAGKEEFINNLDFWIKSISHYTSIVHDASKSPKIIIVGTHMDLLENNNYLDNISELIKVRIFQNGDEFSPALSALLPSSQGRYFFPVSNKSSTGLQELIAEIDSSLIDLRQTGFLSEEFPLQWFHLQEEIRHRVSTGTTVMKYSELEQLAVEECSIGNDLPTVVQFLHDIGQIFFG
jgi:GTPase SAR1 family protein